MSEHPTLLQSRSEGREPHTSPGHSLKVSDLEHKNNSDSSTNSSSDDQLTLSSPQHNLWLRMKEAQGEREGEVEVEELHEAIRDLTAKLREAHAETNVVRHELEFVVSELEKSREDLHAANSDKEQLMKALEHEQNQRASLCDSIAEFKQERVNDHNDEALELQKKNDNLQKELAKAHGECQRVNHECQRLIKEKASLMDDNHKLQLAIAVQSERVKLHSERSAFAKTEYQRQLQESQQELEKSARRENQQQLNIQNLTVRLARLDEREAVFLKRLESFAECKRALARAIKDSELAQHSCKEKEERIKHLESKVERLAEQYRGNLAKLERRETSSLYEKKKEILTTRAHCRRLQDKINHYERQTSEQFRLLKTLDCSLDRLIESP